MAHEMKVDEGYSGGSEETRSLSDSDSGTMHLDLADDHVSKPPMPESMLSAILNLPTEERLNFISTLVRQLPESERYGNAL